MSYASVLLHRLTTQLRGRRPLTSLDMETTYEAASSLQRLVRPVWTAELNLVLVWRVFGSNDVYSIPIDTQHVVVTEPDLK